MKKTIYSITGLYTLIVDNVISTFAGYNQQSFGNSSLSHVKDPFWSIPQFSSSVVVRDSSLIYY